MEAEWLFLYVGNMSWLGKPAIDGSRILPRSRVTLKKRHPGVDSMGFGAPQPAPAIGIRSRFPRFRWPRLPALAACDIAFSAPVLSADAIDIALSNAPADYNDPYRARQFP